MTSTYVYEQEILEEVDRLNFTQIIDFFTTKRNTLDLVFVNDPDNVDAARVHSEFMVFCVKSSHFPTTFTVSLVCFLFDMISNPAQFL